MTVKLIVLYTHPADADEFERHYRDVHAPLVDRVPGLERWESARIAGTPDGGDHTYHRIAELYFRDQAALQSALGSAEGQETAADYERIAPAGSRMFVAVLDD